VHAQGFRLALDADRGLDVRTAHGVAVLHQPARPWGDPADLDPAGRIGPSTVTPPRCESRTDLRYAVSVLMAQAA